MNLRSISQFIASRILGEANGLSRLVPPNTGPTGLNVSSLCSPNDTTEVSAGLRATRSRRSGLDVAENHAWKSLASSRLTAAASEGSCTAMTASTQAPTRAWARPTLGRVRVTAATRSGSPAVRNPRHRGAETRHAFSPRFPMSPSSSHSFTLHSCPGVENPPLVPSGASGREPWKTAWRVRRPRRRAQGGRSPASCGRRSESWDRRRTSTALVRRRSPASDSTAVYASQDPPPGRSAQTVDRLRLPTLSLASPCQGYPGSWTARTLQCRPVHPAAPHRDPADTLPRPAVVGRG